MEIEEQVCSLELAKKLKELGVKQESLFYWVENFRGIQLAGKDNINIEWSTHPHSNKVICSAFTVAELGEILPSKHGSYKDGSTYVCASESMDRRLVEDKTEADARAKMLICLKAEERFLADINF